MRDTFRRFVDFVTERNHPVETLRKGHERTEALRSFYFNVIEGSIILGALQAAQSKSPSILLAFTWLFGFVVLAIYMINSVKLVARYTVERYVREDRRPLALSIAWAANLVLSIFVTHLLSALVSEVIRQTIMI